MQIEQPADMSKVREALRYIVERENFAFAECSEAEEIWSRAKEALDILDSMPVRESVSIEAAKKAMGVLAWIAEHHFVAESSLDSARAFCVQAPIMAMAGYNALRNDTEGKKEKW